MRQWLLGTEGDMLERGLILAAIVVAAVALWVTLGQRLAEKLTTLVARSKRGGRSPAAVRPA